MLASIALGAATLRSGLRLRSARRRGLRRPPGAMRQHLRRAKPTLVLLALGFTLGPASALWLRGWEPFETAHAWLSSLALLLFLATGILGHALERGRVRRALRPRAVEVHGLLGVLSLLAAAAAFGSGFVLLP